MTHLQTRQFEEILLLRDLQKMFLDVAVNLGEQTNICHAAGKVAIRNGILRVHLREEEVSANLRGDTEILQEVYRKTTEPCDLVTFMAGFILNLTCLTLSILSRLAAE